MHRRCTRKCMWGVHAEACMGVHAQGMLGGVYMQGAHGRVHVQACMGGEHARHTWRGACASACGGMHTQGACGGVHFKCASLFILGYHWLPLATINLVSDNRKFEV